ncbi:unnamed protein product [Protopolystoma xenopodis]|uniref:Uncharacterized protein n=1 Tax=Protopolystoma xenopodis TaxID=117903 RepID=A0A448X9B3_9PLAT|nr:unnamed protein product [Protopolystoma xenopodis]
MTTPFIAQVLLPDVSMLAAYVNYSLVAFCCGIFCFLLPIETLGRALMVSHIQISMKKLFAGLIFVIYLFF